MKPKTPMPVISLLHPTARVKSSEGFPRGWRAAKDAWLERADHPENIEYIVSVHESRWSDFWNSDIEPSETSERAWSHMEVVKNEQRDCVVDQINNCALNASGKLLCGVQDDVVPPEHWDTLLLDALRLPHFVLVGGNSSALSYDPDLDGEYLLHFSSGSPRDKDLIVAGAMTRKRYERYGHILDPDFESMFADDWLTFQARRDEAAGLVKIIERLDIEFTHERPGLPNRHGNMRKRDMDEVYALQNRPEAYQKGQRTFTKKAYGTQSLAVCLPGEVFRSEIFWDRISLLTHLNGGLRFLLAPHGHHSSNVYHTRISMTREVLKQFPDIDLVLSVDDDQSLSAIQFEMLYESLTSHPELSGVVGWTWCDHTGKEVNEDGSPNPWMMSVGRQGPWEEGLPAWNFTLAELAQWEREGKTLITSDDLAPDGFWSGFPVVLLRGDCLRELGPLAFKPLMHEKMLDGFTGEDASFFYRARAAGMKFGVDLRVKSNHCKLRAIGPPELTGRPVVLPKVTLPQLESSAAD